MTRHRRRALPAGLLRRPPGETLPPASRQSPAPSREQRSSAGQRRLDGRFDWRGCVGTGAFGARRLHKWRRRLHHRLDFRPAGQRPDTTVVVAGHRIVYSHSRLGQTPKHHERVSRPAAQALRPRDERHQLRVVRTSFLRSAPRKVVSSFEVTARDRIKRRLAAGSRVGAVRLEGDHEDEPEDDDGHGTIVARIETAADLRGSPVVREPENLLENHLSGPPACAQVAHARVAVGLAQFLFGRLHDERVMREGWQAARGRAAAPGGSDGRSIPADPAPRTTTSMSCRQSSTVTAN